MVLVSFATQHMLIIAEEQQIINKRFAFHHLENIVSLFPHNLKFQASSHLFGFPKKLHDESAPSRTINRFLCNLRKIIFQTFNHDQAYLN